MLVDSLPQDHHCAWREYALMLERELKKVHALGEVVAQQQTLLNEQQAMLTARIAELDELGAQQLTLKGQVASLERSLLGPKTEKLRVPPHERERDEPESDEDKARRRAEAERKRRERALARDAKLAVDEVRHAIPEEQLACPTCGGTEHEELPPTETSRIDYEPGRLVKRRHKRQKILRKCGCTKTDIVTAPAPPAPIAGGQYEAGFIALLIVEKCADSMPIHRLEKRFARLSIPIARSTMNDLVLASAERLRPLFDRLAERMANVAIVLADETSMRVQDRDKRGFVWVFHGHDDVSGGQLVLYVFALDRSGETPARILGGSEGTLVVDGYTGYNVVSDPSGRARGGCWCHARRKFFEAKATAEPEADRVLASMRPLFRIEAEAKLRGIVGTDEHLALRESKSRPIVDAIYEMIEETEPTVLPKSPIGAAMRYMKNQRPRLELFLSDSRVPLHNNASEARLRLIALLRKNSLFFGNPRAGRLWAGLFSLVVGAIANEHDPTAYLTDVLTRVKSELSPVELDALLPDRWTPR